MQQLITTSTGCQAGSFYDNEVIPPGVPGPKLPWAYSYAQFNALLTSYPDVHPEDFVTFGILESQPRRGSYSEWGEVAGVLAHMAGGKRTLADELYAIIGRIRRLQPNDPMKAVEEQALVAVVIRERRRSGVPLGDGACATLAAPGGPLAHAAPPRDPRRPPQSSSAPPPRRPTSPQPGPSGARGGPPRPPPGFVDLTEDDEEMDDALATPPPQVSDDSSQGMDTADEDGLLNYGIGRDHDNNDDSDEDGFQHV